MPSLVEVANLALALVGEERVTSLAADTSEAARLCDAFLPGVRDTCLVAHPWNFACRRAEVPALVATPTFGWDYAYQVPSDCLRVLRLDSDDPHEPWAREGDSILCNLAAPLGLRYIAKVTDSGKWAPLFVELVAATLATRLAVPLSASQQTRAALAEERTRILREARSIDAAEGTPDPAYAPADVFVNARL